MEKFQLSILFKIVGIGSASGLLYQNDRLYIISDTSTYLYEYTIAEQKLNKIALLENSQENIPKKSKPDFESIALFDDYIAVLGSGSTVDRNAIVLYSPKSKEIKIQSMNFVYSMIKSQHFFKDDELNIEGFITRDNVSYFFQRGNGLSGKNGIIYGDNTNKVTQYNFVAFDLPKINNVAATFTDAIVVDDKIYFLASAEDTTSTFYDGEIMGSIIGTINLKTMTLESNIQISDCHKFEGLTLFKKTATQIEFLLCDDNDSRLLESTIYKLVLRN